MRIAITGGGTGGHLSIAKALGLECKKRGFYTCYIGGTRGQDRQWFEKDTQTFNEVIFLESMPVVNKRRFAKIKALYQNFTESFRAKQYMQERNIQACISVGGFSAATGGFASLLSKIPLFIHEQNACMGSLNKLLKPFAKMFFSSFTYPNAILTPYPINPIFFEKQRTRESLHYIAFLGGSQGASAINSFATKIAPLLIKKNIKILHQTGANEYEKIKQEYQNLGFHLAKDLQTLKDTDSHIFAFDFSDTMVDIMTTADFCISRAGASSLWELVSNGLPTLFIPYPYAAKNHQYFNAKILSDKGLALLYTQDEILKHTMHNNENRIVDTILCLNLNDVSRSLLQQAQTNGAQIILDNIIESCQ